MSFFSVSAKSVVLLRRVDADCIQLLSKRCVRGDRKSGQQVFEGPGIPLLVDKFFDKHNPVRNQVTTVRPPKSPQNLSRKWQLYGAACLERPAVLSADYTPIEKDFKTLLDRMEFEKSLLSDHEMAKKNDAKKSEAKKKADAEDAVILETAQDREDRWNENLEKFKPVSRMADPQTDADFHSLQRKMDQKLYLIVNQKLGKDSRWIFPQIQWIEGDSLCQTASQALFKTSGPQTNHLFFSHCPVGFYKYKYPSEVSTKNGFYGAKVFFFKAIAKNAVINPSEEITDFMWVTRSELQENVLRKYFNSVEPFLFEFHVPQIQDGELLKMHF